LDDEMMLERFCYSCFSLPCVRVSVEMVVKDAYGPRHILKSGRALEMQRVAIRR
jgi:hypothetical protein